MAQLWETRRFCYTALPALYVSTWCSLFPATEHADETCFLQSESISLPVYVRTSDVTVLSVFVFDLASALLYLCYAIVPENRKLALLTVSYHRLTEVL